MSGGALKLRDVRKLADSRAAFEFQVPVAELPGMPADVSAGGGQVQVRVHFGREQGFAMADVTLSAQLQVICQRCMAPMALSVQTHSPVLVVESEQEAEDAPPGWEAFLAPEGRMSLEALAAEELLLALPIAPLHEPGSACAAAAPVASDARQSAPAVEEKAAATRPFADLRALLQQGAKAPK